MTEGLTELGVGLAEHDDDGPSSWIESRRLILSQLRNLDQSLKDLSTKIDSQAEQARARAELTAQETQKAISNIYVRLAMLEVNAKIWSGGIGLVAGGVSAAIIQVMLTHAVH